MHARATRRGLELTELGLGTAQLGNLYRVTTDAEATETIEAAWGAGIRYFDTAPHYGVGLSERRLGAELAGYPRDEYVVSTKVGPASRAEPRDRARARWPGVRCPGRPAPRVGLQPRRHPALGRGLPRADGSRSHRHPVSARSRRPLRAGLDRGHRGAHRAARAGRRHGGRRRHESRCSPRRAHPPRRRRHRDVRRTLHARRR